ncbi:MAG: 2-C-methyl-D-erythritol 4-phosphate cytidylyltransferase [Gammaproteobacteria bacterium]|jgi:2-C-methyl-D-erythritol 4-phosphate cytidylyltransferase
MFSGAQADPGYWAVVPAAGAGTRMGAERPKQYLTLGERTVLEHTLEALLACDVLSGIVVVVAEQDTYWPAIAPRYRDRPLVSVSGGAERCHSVQNGLHRLAGLAGPHDRVLVHDAARPCLRADDVNRLIKTVGDDENGGLLGVPVADTMKRVNGALRVAGTVERNGLWHALTPQLFRIDLLDAALAAAIDAGVALTDEASAMEHAGHAPRMVQGSRDNIKITLPADLGLASYYLHARRT